MFELKVIFVLCSVGRRKEYDSILFIAHAELNLAKIGSPCGDELRK